MSTLPAPIERYASDLEKFMENVDLFRSPSGCWIWLASLNSQSKYGQVNFHGNVRMAYTVAYEIFVGPVPKGLTLDHACHSEDLSCKGGVTCAHRRCVNPWHLELMTWRENFKRSRHPSAQALRTDHCIRGHAFDSRNTRIRRNGTRCCKACQQIRDAKYKAKAAN